jgi:hypothetical protein
LESGSIANGMLNAMSLSGVYVTQPSGDLRIGSIKTTSPNGTVSITTQNGNITDGNIPDALELNTGKFSPAQVNQIINAIRIKEENAANTTVAAFEGLVNASYLQYWTALDNGSVTNGTLTLTANGVLYYQPNANIYFANSANQTSNATEAQVNSYANMLYDNSVSVFENTIVFGPNWATLPQFQTYNSTYNYIASNATISSITYGAFSFSNDFSLLSIDALSPRGQNLLGNTTSPAIETTFLNLNSSGSIGLSLDPVEISINSIQNGTLTRNEQSLLTLANSAGELQMVGTNAQGQRVVYTYGNEPANITVTGVIVKIEKPLFVNVADNGQVQLNAGTSISLTETAGDMNISNVSTPGNVRLVSGASINQVPAASQNMLVLNPTINNLVQDSDFETPALGTGNFTYNTSGSSWTFAGGSGISGNDSGFTNSNSNAPVGSQVAFIQTTGVMSQTISGLVAGQLYTLSFYAAQRGWDFKPSITYQTFNVTLGDQTLAANVNPVSTSYQLLTYSFTSTSSGSQTLTFTGLDPTNQDETVFLDQVSITPAVAITAKNLHLTTGADIGSSASLLSLNITGELNSYSGGDQYLTQNTGNLLMGTAYSGGNAQITANGSIYTIGGDLQGSTGTFGGNGQGWQTGAVNANATISDNILTLTNNASEFSPQIWNSFASATLLAPVTTENGFVASFVYQSTTPGSLLTFMLSGPDDYSRITSSQPPLPGQLTQSVGFGIYPGGGSSLPQYIGLYANGHAYTPQTPIGVNLTSGHPIEVALVYNSLASALSVTLTDNVTNDTYSFGLNDINLLKLLGVARCNPSFLSWGTSGATSATITGFNYSWGSPTFKAGSLSVTSGGSIGTANQPILTLVSGCITATAPNGVYLLQTDGDLYVNSVSSQADVSLAAPAGSVLNGSPGSIQASSLNQPSAQSLAIRSAALKPGGIIADQLQLSALNQLGTANNPLTSQVRGLSAHNRFGDLMIENSGPLSIENGTSQNGIMSGGTVQIIGDSDINVNSPVVASGSVKVQGTKLYVNQGSVIESLTSSVNLFGSDLILIATGGTVKSSSSGGNSLVELNSFPMGEQSAAGPALQSLGQIVADNIRFNSGNLGTGIFVTLQGILGQTVKPSIEFNAGSGFDTLTINDNANVNGIAMSIAEGRVQTVDKTMILNAIDSVFLELGQGEDQVNIGSNLPLDQLHIFTQGGSDSITTTLGKSSVKNLFIDGGADADSINIDAAGQNAWASPGEIQSWQNLIQYNAIESVTLHSATTINAQPVLNNPAAEQIPAGLDSNQQYINYVFQQVLNRLATPTELNRWARLLDRNAISRYQFAYRTTNTDEARLLRINAWYLNYYGRSATKQESNQALRRIRSGRSETSVLGGILNSQEFFQRTQTLVSNGSSRDRFITALYKLAIDPSGSPSPVLQQFLTRTYMQKGRPAVIMNVLQSSPVAINQAEGLSIQINKAPASQNEIKVRLKQSRPNGLQSLLISNKIL